VNNTPEINVSELAQELENFAINFRKVWPQWMAFLTELRHRDYSLWKFLEGNIWIAFHYDIVQYINARDEQGNPTHPRSFNDESADFAGYRDYARCDARLTEIYKQMNPAYPELEQQIFDALDSARQHGDAASSQNARRAEEAFSELQSSLNAHFSILSNSHRDPNDVAKDVADCLTLTAEALQNSSNKNNANAPIDANLEYGTFHAKVINVMVASPSDVADERKAIRELIYEWNSINAENERIILLPKMWETDTTPQMGNRPQEIVNQQLLRKCALLVAVFWTRLGTPTGKAQSGTVEEIHEHAARGQHMMIYFSKQAIPQEGLDRAQYKALQEFKVECQKDGLICEYDHLEDFKGKFRKNIQNAIKQYFPRGAIPVIANPIASISRREPADLTEEEPKLTPEAEKLLLEASNDPTGIIINFNNGEIIQTNNKVLNNEKDARDCAKWRKALQILQTYSLIERLGYEGESFKLTSDGYEAADKIKAKRSPNQ
jgi:hypothetical protein